MATVSVIPMPDGVRKLPERLRSLHPPIFPDGTPTDADVAFAIELIETLDEESQRWYGNTLARLKARLGR